MSTKRQTPKLEVLYGCIYVFKNILSEQECDELLEHFDKKEKHKATTVGYKMPSITDPDNIKAKEFDDENVRKGSIKFDKDLYSVPYGERLVMALDGYASEFGIKLFDDDVDFQLAIYDNVGDHFLMHEDHKMDIATFESRQRKVSASLQLSNDNEYKGCSLEVRLPIDDEGRRPNLIASRQKGDMIVFPSFAKHKVSKLESGVRNSMVLWYHGPAWR